MLTFSAICDDFVKAVGFTKLECADDSEARNYAADMDYESDFYPVVYFKSDTTGEKAYEEFYIPGEKIDMERFMALGVIEETSHRSMVEIDQFFDDLETLFASPEFTKAQIVKSIKNSFRTLNTMKKEKSGSEDVMIYTYFYKIGLCIDVES